MVEIVACEMSGHSATLKLLCEILRNFIDKFGIRIFRDKRELILPSVEIDIIVSHNRRCTRKPVNKARVFDL
jgi:hypothetical protein